MTSKNLDNFSKKIKGKLRFDYSIKNHTWLNIGGNAKIFFVPETLTELRDFLLNIKNENNNFFIIGAGSNLLISENIQDRIFIKLGKNFNKLSLTKDNVIIAGGSILDRKVSDFACENHLSGLEFLSCIPGTVGGGIRMNSGCFGSEFKDVLLSVQVMDFDGRVYTINSRDINFNYRKTNLPKNLIFLSASFKANKKNMNEVKENIHRLKEKKEKSQPLRVKTGGSTFKNPKSQTEKKVWELIQESIDGQISFGDAKISEKHSNFFVNSKNASFENMYNLINFVKSKVKEKTGISLELELEIVN
ncbi:UDP-N-acetylmuramate dehydrogenase [Candidatus Pelagibacter sp.]|nr:UDP-N-acetylmuramate dehydrogenase [Candidatus Pelagibacter sp.]|tara:strand:+ start:304 stop:1215 length:912 start_codon:yes stop_codon:yes gene_type:complete